MVSSGIKVSQQAIDAYNEMQTKSTFKYIIIGFDENYTKVELKSVGNKDQSFDDFLQVLPEDKACYAFYDCAYKTKSGQQRNKILRVLWSSDEKCPGKEKMLISSTENEVRQKCPKYARGCSINCRSDLTEDNFINIVSDNRTY